MAEAIIGPSILASVLNGVGSAVFGGVLSKAMGGKDKTSAPAGPPTANPDEVDKAARDAQKKQRQAAAAAVGRADTIATPPGLGSAESTGNAQVKTILGL